MFAQVRCNWFARPLYWLGRGVLIFWVLLGSARVTSADTVEKLFQDFCSSCHGEQMQGGSGSNLTDAQWLHGSAVEAIAATIKNGAAGGGMPAFAKTFSDQQLYALATLIREQAAAQSPPPPVANADGIFNAAGHAFKLEKVAELPGTMWSMAFLPDGKILATQQEGNLWLVDQGRVEGPIKDTPAVWFNVQGGPWRSRCILVTRKTVGSI